MTGKTKTTVWIKSELWKETQKRCIDLGISNAAAVERALCEWVVPGTSKPPRQLGQSPDGPPELNVIVSEKERKWVMKLLDTLRSGDRQRINAVTEGVDSVAIFPSNTGAKKRDPKPKTPGTPESTHRKPAVDLRERIEES